MGLGNKFKEVKKAYVEANKLLGDLIKVSTEQAAEQHPKQEKVTFHRFLLQQVWLESNSISMLDSILLFLVFIFQFPRFPAFIIYQHSLCNYLTLLCILFMAPACCLFFTFLAYLIPPLPWVPPPTPLPAFSSSFFFPPIFVLSSASPWNF